MSDGNPTRLPTKPMSREVGREEKESVKKKEGSTKKGSYKDKELEQFESQIITYEKQIILGQGTFGKVYKARHKPTDNLVAIKQLLMEKEKQGFPLTTIREIKILRSMNHKNLIKIIDVIASVRKPMYWMIYEYVEHDLMGLLTAMTTKFVESEVKSIMLQLLHGVHYLHKKGVIHRDLKTSNLLVTKHGEIKIADFGLAVFLRKDKRGMTNRVVTRWYRAPELLLGSTHYTQAVDLWSIGCIFGEFMTGGKPILQGKDGLDQLKRIFSLCGTPSDVTWEDCKKLSNWKTMRPTKVKKRILEKHFEGKLSKNGIDLFSKLMRLDPKKRYTAKQCLTHPWFLEKPIPMKPKNLPTDMNYNEKNANKIRHQHSVGRNSSNYAYNVHSPPHKRRKYENDNRYQKYDQKPSFRPKPSYSRGNYRGSSRGRGTRGNGFGRGRNNYRDNRGYKENRNNNYSAIKRRHRE